MSTIADGYIPLLSITRLSPFNPRQDMESDVTTLAATIRARGLFHPILVRSVSRDDGYFDYHVLDGGRRWRALLALGETDIDVAVKIFDGTDAEAREAALAAAATQKPLHPVEEFEAFSDLERAGFDVATIAKDFALSERHVRQRLALGRLSPRVRDYWKKGLIGRDFAEAFAVGTIEAQEALLAEWGAAPQRPLGVTPYHVRRAMRREAVEAHEPLAKFLLANPARLALYQQEGGRVEESLFEEERILLDRSIANRVTDRLLLEEAQCVAEAEGWGAALSYDAMGEDPLDIEGDYLPEEDTRLDRIAIERRETADQARHAELDAEEAAIVTRAQLRAVSRDRRATLGVTCDLNDAGGVDIIRAVPLVVSEEAGDDDAPAESAAQPAAPNESSGSKKAAERKAREAKPAPAPPEPPAKIGRELKAIIDDAANLGLADVVACNPGLALAFAVAAIGCSHGAEAMRLRCNGYLRGEARSQILRDIEHERFEQALAICSRQEYSDLDVALAEVVARSIDVAEAASPKTLQILLGVASRQSDIGAALARNFDYRGYFEATPKDEAIDALRALAGEAVANDSGKMKKADRIARAETIARDKKWLPPIFAEAIDSPPADTRSTAQAMQEAIAADEATQSAAAPETATAPVQADPKLRVETFIELCCDRAPKARLKAADAYAAFVAFSEARELAPIGFGKFGEAITALGIEKQRLSKGVHYLGLALTKSAPPAVEENDRINCGDIMLHRPSGDVLIVAAADHEAGALMWRGGDGLRVQISDCEIMCRATPEESALAHRQLSGACRAMADRVYGALTTEE